MTFPRQLVDAILIQNNDFMVMCIRVRGSTLARLAIGNERLTVNLVTARITRRAGAPPSMNLSFFQKNRNFRNFNQKMSTFPNH